MFLHTVSEGVSLQCSVHALLDLVNGQSRPEDKEPSLFSNFFYTVITSLDNVFS